MLGEVYCSETAPADLLASTKLSYYFIWLLLWRHLGRPPRRGRRCPWCCHDWLGDALPRPSGESCVLEHYVSSASLARGPGGMGGRLTQRGGIWRKGAEVEFEMSRTTRWIATQAGGQAGGWMSEWTSTVHRENALLCTVNRLTCTRSVTMMVSEVALVTGRWSVEIDG
jgi:hypothetical protein